jgi:hypothetical protein
LRREKSLAATDGAASRKCQTFHLSFCIYNFRIVSRIVLTTLNARYIHAAFGLRYLPANLGPLRAQACIVEFDLQQRPLEIVETILAQEPPIVSLGVYIWNVAPATEVVAGPQTTGAPSKGCAKIGS